MKRENFRVRPTGLWIVFGPVLGCIWLAAVNYENNLVYAILYLIAALSFVSIFHTWRNLAGLNVEHVRINPAFAGEDVLVEVFLQASAQNPVFGLVFSRMGDVQGRQPLSLRTGDCEVQRLSAGDSSSIELIFPAVRRGLYRIESIQIRSTYPFGLFYASFSVTVGAEYYVYPTPQGSDTWPELRPGGDKGSPNSMRPGDDFYGVRPYVPGESVRHIDWKAYARGRGLSVKQFTGGEGQELWLDASEMTRMPIETRLSQLAHWIVNAEKAEMPYALKLGRVVLPLGMGPFQARRALETLAVAGMGPEERKV